MTAISASGEILPVDDGKAAAPPPSLAVGANVTALDLTAFLPLWPTTAAAGGGGDGGGNGAPALLRSAAAAANPEYARTIGLIEAIFADDCVFHPTPENYVMIVAFCIIFCLSVVGNSVVVVVILQRSMRSVTNLYLLNLALSDLLLSVVCMPPTLVSSLVYCWVFGDLLCKLLAYLQPVVVTASAYTLAAIALERYYAIVRPLHSRVWHTKSHALLVIGLVWLISIIANLFMLFMYELRTYNRNGLNCAPKYDASVHFAYQIYMTVTLLIVPLVIMTGLYGAVIRTLRSGIKMDIAAVDASNYESNELLSKVSSVVQPTSQPAEPHDKLSKQASNRSKLSYGSYTAGRRAGGVSPRVPPRQLSAETPLENGAAAAARINFDGNNNTNTNNKYTDNNNDRKMRTAKNLTRASWSSVISMRCRRPNAANFSFLPHVKKVSAARVMLPAASPYSDRSSFDDGRAASAGAGGAELGARSVRSTHSGRTAVVKQRLIRMLIVIVIIFFCCWTPSYIWWLLLNAQDSFGTFNVWNSELNTFITVLTYLSSCTNPITYCFLNSKFRNALFLSFGCKRFSRRAVACAHVQRVYGGGGGGGGPKSPPAVQNGATGRMAQSFRYATPRGALRSAPSAEREFSSNDNYCSEQTTGGVDPATAPSPVSPPPTLNGRAASTRSSARPATGELDASLLARDSLARVRPHSLGRFDLLGRMRDAFARHHPPHLYHSNTSSATRSGFSSPADEAPPTRHDSDEERVVRMAPPSVQLDYRNGCSSSTSLGSEFGLAVPTIGVTSVAPAAAGI